MVTRKRQFVDFATLIEVFDQFSMRLGKWHRRIVIEGRSGGQTLLVIHTAGQASSGTPLLSAKVRRNPPATFALLNHVRKYSSAKGYNPLRFSLV